MRVDKHAGCEFPIETTSAILNLHPARRRRYTALLEHKKRENHLASSQLGIASSRARLIVSSRRL
ncbi:MAG: hypothetical protein QXP54_05885, partial [Thermofilum sp.]